MNLIELICRELGVEVGESWIDSRGHKFKIELEDGLLMWDKERNIWITNIYPGVYVDFLNGKFNPIWKPQIGDYYWTIDFTERDRVFEYVWYNDEHDQILLEDSLVFSTRERAIEVANEMLSTLKERG